MEKRYLEYLQDVLITLHQNLHETRERKLFADPAELDYIEGKLMAYQEILAIMRQSAQQFHLPTHEIGLG
ncbi:MAG: hypothetical protein MUC97_05400 [Bernardetiaceae bacterium]|jgi:hypothetical protein|nr:hypothetical protein [Bernardetiaceae bacterium]